VPYDPAWPQSYEAECARLKLALGAKVLAFEHMGSTAVPGMRSKPIIDISVAVADLGSVPSLFPVLHELGYAPIPQNSTDRYDLWKQCPGKCPSHILHFMVKGSGAWIRPIIFRNALRADAELRDRYGDLKERLASEFGDDIQGYGKAKTDFVRGVVEPFLIES